MAIETDTERAVFLDTDDFAKSATLQMSVLVQVQQLKVFLIKKQ